MNPLTRQAIAISTVLLFVVPSAAQTLPSGVIDVPSAAFPSIGDSQSIGSDTTLNVTDGGSVGRFFDAGASGGSSANVLVRISGGNVGPFFDAFSGSTVIISGGSVDSFFDANPGSSVTVSGGVLGAGFLARLGSTTEFVGDEFVLNGSPFAGASITFAAGDVFTGTFADGSSFVFAWESGDGLNSVTLTRAALPTGDPTPIVVDATSPAAPTGLRSGQTLTLLDGGVVGDNFSVVDATLNIEGGNVGSGIEVAAGTASINGGVVGPDFRAFANSTININGGILGERFGAYAGSTVNVRGGEIVRPFTAYSGSTVNVIGSEFLLNGVLLDLVTGVPTVFSDRDVVLSGLLADGTPFEFDLAQRARRWDFFVASEATLTLTLVIPEPTSSVLLGLVAWAGVCRGRRGGGRMR